MKDQHLFAKLSLGCAVAASLVLAGCASKSPAPVVERSRSSSQPLPAPAVVVPPVPEVLSKELYTVKKGDTLYGIALDHGLDYKELAAWNAIDNPNRILIGQQLRVTQAQTLASEVALVKPITLTLPVEKRVLEANSDTLKREPKVGKEPYSEQTLAQAQLQAQGPQKLIEQPPSPGSLAAEVKSGQKSELKQEPTTGGDEIAWVWPANGKMVATFSEGVSKGVDIAGKAGDPVVAAGDGKVVYSGTGLRGYGKLLIIKHNNTYLSAYAHNQNVLLKEGQSVSKGQKIAEMGNTDTDHVKLHFEVRRQGKPVDPLKYLPQR
jgi:lipoprotein NlpD